MTKRWQYQQSANVVLVIPPPPPPDWGMFSSMSQPTLIQPPAQLFKSLFTDVSLTNLNVLVSGALLFESGIEPSHKTTKTNTEPTHLLRKSGSSPA